MYYISIKSFQSLKSFLSWFWGVFIQDKGRGRAHMLDFNFYISYGLTLKDMTKVNFFFKIVKFRIKKNG